MQKVKWSHCSVGAEKHRQVLILLELVVPEFIFPLGFLELLKAWFWTRPSHFARELRKIQNRFNITTINL